jgi:hypothetical protein
MSWFCRPLKRPISLRALLCVFFILAFLLQSQFTSTKAQPVETHKSTFPPQVENPCRGLDIVFLYADTSSVKYNDKLLQRREAIWTAVDMLYDNLVYFCPDYQHRISVIGFGDDEQQPDEGDAKPYFAPYTMDPTVDTTGNSTVWDEVKNKIPDPRLIPAFGSRLHFEPALNAAYNQFQDWKKNPPDPNRKQALIILSDGNMCYDSHCDLESEVMKIQKYVDANGKYFPWHGKESKDSVYVYHIRMSPGDDPINNPVDFFKIYLREKSMTIGEFWDKVTEDHGGPVAGENNTNASWKINADGSSENLATVMNSLLGSQLRNLDCNQPTFTINPYIDSLIVLRVFRTGAEEDYQPSDVRVRIVGKKGQQILLDVTNGTRVVSPMDMDFKYDKSDNGLNERYILISPPPGEYHVEAEYAEFCRDVSIQIGHSSIGVTPVAPTQDTELVEDFVPPAEDINSPHVFKVALTLPQANGASVPMGEIIGYPISNMKLKVSGPMSVEYTYDISLIDSAKAIYATVDPQTKRPQYIQTAVPGEYTWQVTAETIDPRDNTKKINILNQTGKFTVTAILRKFTFSFTLPKNTQPIHLADNANMNKIDLAFQVTQPDGSPLPKGLKISPDGVIPFSAALIISQDEKIPVDEITIGKDGQYYTTVTKAGGFTEGQYTLRIDLIPNKVDKMYLPERNSIEQLVSFIRSPFDISLVGDGKDVYFLENEPTKEMKVVVNLQQNGEKLRSDLVGQKDQDFLTLTLADAGKSLDKVTLPYDGSNEFSATLKNNNNFVDGKCYEVKAALVDGKVNSRLFNPNATEKTYSLCIKMIRLLDWSIAQPDKDKDYPLHPMLAWFPPPDPGGIAVKVSYAMQEKSQINAEALQAGTKGILFSGMLTEVQSGNEYKLNFKSDKEKGLFIADWPEAANRTGQYKVAVDLNADAIPRIYALDRTKSTHNESTFRLHDTLLSMPWSRLALIILSLYVLVAWLILPFLTQGKLLGVSLDYKADQLPLWGNFNRRKHVLPQKTIQEFFGETVESITARQIDPIIRVEGYDEGQEQPKRAVQLDVTWHALDSTGGLDEQGNPVWVKRSESFRANEGEMPFEYFSNELPDVTVTYNSDRNLWARVTRWLTVSRILFIIGFVIVVIYLYFAAA